MMFAQGGEPLGHAVRWPTPRSRDYKDGGREPAALRRESPTLPTMAARYAQIGVINPSWVDLLMGFPAGWSDVDGVPAMVHKWPLGRGADQAEHEPPRLVDRKLIKNKSKRLRALGNAVVPQQATAAIERMLQAVRS